MKTLFILGSCLVLLHTAARAGDADCDKIRAAYQLTGSKGVQMKNTGYGFARDTPQIYGLGDHTCSYLRDETVDGEPVAVYREQYKAKRRHDRRDYLDFEEIGTRSERGARRGYRRQG